MALVKQLNAHILCFLQENTDYSSLTGVAADPSLPPGPSYSVKFPGRDAVYVARARRRQSRDNCNWTYWGSSHALKFLFISIEIPLNFAT